MSAPHIGSEQLIYKVYRRSCPSQHTLHQKLQQKRNYNQHSSNQFLIVEYSSNCS